MGTLAVVLVAAGGCVSVAPDPDCPKGTFRTVPPAPRVEDERREPPPSQPDELHGLPVHEEEEGAPGPFGLLFEGALGVQDADTGLDHAAGSVTVGLRHVIADPLEVELRARYVTGGDAGDDADGDGADDDDRTNLHALAPTAELALGLWDEHAVAGGSAGWRLDELA